MTTIEAFDNDRLVGYLNRQEWSWLRSQEGAFVVDLTTDFGVVRLQLATEGEAEAPVLLVRVGRDAAFGPDDWLPLLSTINSWNSDYRFAKAYMHFIDDDLAILLAETQVPMSAGVHDELLDLVIDVSLAAAVEFHRFVSEKVSASADAEQPSPPAPSAHELEAWLDRSA